MRQQSFRKGRIGARCRKASQRRQSQKQQETWEREQAEKLRSRSQYRGVKDACFSKKSPIVIQQALAVLERQGWVVLNHRDGVLRYWFATLVKTLPADCRKARYGRILFRSPIPGISPGWLVQAADFYYRERYDAEGMESRRRFPANFMGEWMEAALLQVLQSSPEEIEALVVLHELRGAWAVDRVLRR